MRVLDFTKKNKDHRLFHKFSTSIASHPTPRASQTGHGGGYNNSFLATRYTSFRSNRLVTLALTLAIFPLSLLTTVFISHRLTPVVDTDATISPTDYTVSLSTTGNITMSVTTTPDGAYASNYHTVTTSTNSPSGYKLYLSTTNPNYNGLYLSGNTANSTDQTKTIAATTGTFNTPSPLGSNTWGFAMTGGAFDSTYSTPIPGTTSKWAAVPKKGSEQLIKSTTTANSSTTSTSPCPTNSSSD